MTIKIILTRLPLLLVAFAFVGISYVGASEVTGVLSSDTTGSTQASGTGSISGTVTADAGNNGSITGTVTDNASGGSISGTVTNNASEGSISGTVTESSRSGGSSISGSRRNSSGSSLSDPPAGVVLGAATGVSPGFPNAGGEPGQAGSQSDGRMAVTALALLSLLALGTARMTKYTS